jgi:hypothetical protein
MLLNYKVVGMSAPKSFTLFETNDHCWAKDGLPNRYYESLFKKAKETEDFWKQEIIATVECEETGVHNSPINGIVKEVFINGELFKL